MARRKAVSRLAGRVLHDIATGDAFGGPWIGEAARHGEVDGLANKVGATRRDIARHSPRLVIVHRINHASWMFWKFANLRIILGG